MEIEKLFFNLKTPQLFGQTRGVSKQSLLSRLSFCLKNTQAQMAT